MRDKPRGTKIVTDSVDGVPLEEWLCFSLYSTSIAMNRTYKPLLDRLGITYPQFLVLQSLWEEDGRTIGTIAERLSLEPSSITPMSKRLAAAGFVRRDRDPDNERHVRVFLTAEGQALRREGDCVADEILQRTGLSLAKMRSLATEVQKVREALASSG